MIMRALAIATLRNVLGDPGCLHLVQRVAGRKPLDRGDLLAFGFADRNPAGTDGNAVHVNGAGAALRNAAAIFGAGQAGILTNRPEQRRIGLHVEREGFSVDC
ncbi:hypothetical protein ABIF20_001054 [Bradyrhizobium japonicum]